MADSRTTPISSASSSPAWVWVRRIGLFLLAYSVTALFLLVLPSLTNYYLNLAYQLAAAGGVALAIWVWLPKLRPVAVGLFAGAVTYTVFMYWLFDQVGRGLDQIG